MLGFVAFGMNAFADISLPSAPPPQPVGQTVQIRKGESVDLPLRGVTRSGLQLKFLIRNQPKLGTLAQVRVIDRGSATVRYTHIASNGPGVDRVRYAVQAPGTSVSTPAEIIIEILEAPPVFIAPERLVFPAVAAGRTRTLEVELRNDGGGFVQGQLELPEPWIFPQGDGSYSLPEGGRVTLPITFAPQAAGSFSSTARFSHQGSRGIVLSGDAVAPVEFSPDRLELKAAPSVKTRSAVLTLQNRTPERRLIEVSVPAELENVAPVLLASNATAEVQLRTRPDFLGTLEGVVKLSGEGIDATLPLRVFSSPAEVILVDPKPGASLDFGTVLTGRPAHGEIMIRNVGGTEASLRATVPDGFQIQPTPTGETLAPGGERRYKVSLKKPEAGLLREVIRLEANGVPAIQIPVVADVKPDISAIVAKDRGGVKLPIVVPPEIRARPNPGIYPAVQEIGVLRRTKNELQLTWKHPSASIDRYAVLERKIEFNDQGQAIGVWKEVINAAIEMDADHAVLTLTNLRPGQRLTLGIAGYDASGQAGDFSAAFVVDSEHRKPFRIPWKTLGAIIFVAAVWMLWRERRRRFAGQE